MDWRRLNHMGSTQEAFLKEVVFKGGSRQERGKGGKGGGETKEERHTLDAVFPSLRKPYIFEVHLSLPAC